MKAPNLFFSLTDKTPRKRCFLLGMTDKKITEDSGQGPGLGQNTITLMMVPPSIPRPLCPSTPTVLNCSALTSSCHLLYPQSLLPHCAESALTSHPPPPHSSSYPRAGLAGRQINEEPHPPTRCLLVSSAQLCHRRWVSLFGDWLMHPTSSGDICIMVFDHDVWLLRQRC